MTLQETFDFTMNSCGFWEENPVVAVGFSGGCDSLALLRLTQAWCSKVGGRLVALHVNHAMRAESHEQAQNLVQWCQDHDVSCVVLKPNNVPRNQQQARMVRYELLGSWCHANTVHHMLVGHHKNDQCETVAMRCLRGSGVQGLSGMSVVSVTAWGRLLRPLLELSPDLWKTRAVIEDPSNHNPRYERVRVRRALTPCGLKLCDDVQRWAQELLAVRVQSAQSFFVQNVRCWRNGSCRVDADITRQNRESMRWMLERIMMTVSGKTFPARGRVVCALQHRLCLLKKGKRLTAGGCVFLRDDQYIHVMRETKRVKTCALEAGAARLFDGRFYITNKTKQPVQLCASDKKEVTCNVKSCSLPIFMKKRSNRRVYLIPYKRKVYGFFAPRMPLFGRRL